MFNRYLYYFPFAHTHRCNGMHWMLHYPWPHPYFPLQEAEQEQGTPSISLPPHPLLEHPWITPWDPATDAVFCHECHYVWELSQSVVHVTPPPWPNSSQWRGITCYLTKYKEGECRLVLKFVSLTVQYSTVALVCKYLALEMSALWRLVRRI